jgi:hypothetical protein
MRNLLGIAPAAALALSLAGVPGIAAAEKVIVILGSEVATVDRSDGFAREARRAVAPTVPRHRGGDPSPPAPIDTTPQVIVVFVDARDYPETAWGFVSPWDRGIKVHGGRARSKLVASGPPARVSWIRLHGASGERAPWAIPTLGLGGDGSHIKVHGMGSRPHSRIRVHGWSR